MKELKAIDRKLILKNLGYEAELVDEDFRSKIDLCEEEVLANIHPRYMCRAFDLVLQDGKIVLPEPDLMLPGSKITNELYYCNKAVFFCATLSGDIELSLDIAGREDVEKAVIMDSIASAALEDYCDLIELDIAEKFPGYQLTYRFSTRYGDMSEGCEYEFAAIMDTERKIGVSFTEAGTATPRYSIIAILGLKNK